MQSRPANLRLEWRLAEDGLRLDSRDVVTALEALQANVLSMSEIRENLNADYWFRATAKHEDFAEVAANW